jgi:hypothetical protein
MGRPTLLERFQSKYHPDPETGCWLWIAGRFAQGYALIAVHRQAKKAHRIAWELFRGPIPPGMLVCHTCDIMHCVNPEHLFLGTHLDNTRDMIAKGRHRFGMAGERNPRAKLTLDQVREIRSSSENQYVLAERYGVTQSNISIIQSGVNWKHAR